MTEKMNTKKYTDRDWEELASSLSEEKGSHTGMFTQFLSEDSHNTGENWKAIRNMSSNEEIDVDKAWNKVSSRIIETGDMAVKNHPRIIIMRSSFIKIAAAALILLGLGTAALYFANTGSFSQMITVVTDVNQKNLEVTLPDGSLVILNRNTELTYRSSYGRSGRKVALTGEAFFKITPDAENPFRVDAGTAQVKVLGTSFNVITNNVDSAVEVFVRTGQVELSDNTGGTIIVLDPGYVGTVDSKLSGKSINNNPNYMSWNTGLLIYDGQKLDVVFRDLKRVYNMEIVADDPAILTETWTSPINNQTQDTIIRLICASFNLSYSKDGNVYHLAKK